MSGRDGGRRKGPAELEGGLPQGRRTRCKPEVMSPAGHWPELQAAVEAGADAVYFGLRHFSARAKVGFAAGELAGIMRFLHRRGVKGYVTFNTLVFEHELAAAAEALAAVSGAGADAVIVQDAGIAGLVRRLAPDLSLHASTQMSLTSAEGVEWARRLGAERVVLGRELSLKDLRAVRAATEVELEVFVHGALCVSYSGQCFSSEAWGGRSANRGQCAQACRLPYELEVDGARRDLGDKRYLLSPGDLYAAEQVPELVEIGVSSLKIEGRYKGPEYVALVTDTYRRAVDAAWDQSAAAPEAADALRLGQVYSRGLGPHFVAGTDHQSVVDGRAPRHRGLLMGEVIEVGGGGILLRPAEADAAMPLKAGDGVVFDAAQRRDPEEKEEGGRLYEVDRRAAGVWLSFGNGAVDFSRIAAGDWLWRTHDPETNRAARPFLKPAAPVTRQPVALRARVRVGEKARLVWRLVRCPEIEVEVVADEAAGAARNQALDEAYLGRQCGRLGQTPYALHAVELDSDGRAFVPASQLADLKRRAVEALAAAQEEVPARPAPDPTAALAACAPPALAAPDPAAVEQASRLHLLVRSAEQLEAVLDLGPDSVTLDYLDLYGLRPAVERVRQAGLSVRVASPRVLKPAEQKILHFLLKLGCPLLVRSSGLLQALAAEAGAPELIGDFSLNAANSLAARAYLDMGLARLTPSYDLNAAQVRELAGRVGAERVEVALYQHLPVFHTEHCVFSRFLSEGSSFRDCGKPCERHKVAVRDRNGRSHPVMADVGCRNTVFGAQAQEASAHLEDWRAAGIRHFRLEFAHEGAAEVRALVEAYAAALEGELDGRALGRRVAAVAPQGRTEGSLYVAGDYLEIEPVA